MMLDLMHSNGSIRLLTIGAYGFTSHAFFSALVRADVDLLCDLRFHRGMRGSLYPFANSIHLQQSLAMAGIRYQHRKELAPCSALRELQEHADRAVGVAKRTRTSLAQSFIDAYEQCYLSTLDAHDFITDLGPCAGTIALFCVEREPGACHRSLVAAKLARDLDLEVEHIVPTLHTIE